MRKIRILNIVPDIYTEGIAVSVKDRQALTAALKEETGDWWNLRAGSLRVEVSLLNAFTIRLWLRLTY